MGGLGSGEWFRYGSKKSTTDSQHQIDIRWMKKNNRLHPGTTGSLSWSRRGRETGSVNYRMEENQMTLYYRYRPHGGEWEQVEQTIPFDRTSCNYGGCRTWFLCPHCMKRVAVLCGAGQYFLCRHCHDLVYTSQQENRCARLARKSRNIRRRLNASESLMELVLFKPKNMRQKTFDRLRYEVYLTDERYFQIAGARLQAAHCLLNRTAKKLESIRKHG